MSALQLIDTRNYPVRDAYPRFREAVESAFLPWQSEHNLDTPFEYRMEAIAFEKGGIGKISGVPTTSTRGSLEISRSREECFVASFILTGELIVEQASDVQLARPGELVFFDCSSPVTVRTVAPTGRHFSSAIALKIPKGQFEALEHRKIDACMITRAKMTEPLFSCFECMSNNLTTASPEELKALYDASMSLLPLSLVSGNSKKRNSAVYGMSYGIARALVTVIEERLQDPALTASRAAMICGISERYVHKIFAARGTTFGAYVLAQRLEHVRLDLANPAHSNDPIFWIAYRWGFSDLSTFNRNFKKHFGKPPRNYRAR